MVTKQEVKTLIDTALNDILSSHGGFVDLCAIEQEGELTKVILEFYGGCSGCPARFTFTLKMIESILRRELDNQNIVVENVESF
jgi:Fe-S cluster biogenesis protein NfuA